MWKHPSAKGRCDAAHLRKSGTFRQQQGTENMKIAGDDAHGRSVLHQRSGILKILCRGGGLFLQCDPLPGDAQSFQRAGNTCCLTDPAAAQAPGGNDLVSGWFFR